MRTAEEIAEDVDHGCGLCGPCAEKAATEAARTSQREALEAAIELVKGIADKDFEGQQMASDLSDDIRALVPTNANEATK